MNHQFHNPFGFWENIQYTIEHFQSLAEGLQYTFFLVINYIEYIKYFPELYDVWQVEVDLIDFSPSKNVGDIMYYDATMNNTYKNRILPHNDNPPRGWRSANVADFHNTLYPRFWYGYFKTGCNMNYPHWSFSWRVIEPVTIIDVNLFGYMNQYHYGKYNAFEVVMITLRDSDLAFDYATPLDYVYKDYIKKDNKLKTEKVYVYDFLETKIPKIRMNKNHFVQKWNYYNDSMNKSDFYHHDYKGQAIITTNHFVYEMRNYYDRTYSKFNPLIWKEGPQNLMGFYILYYDYFGYPEARWMMQFSYSLENIYEYWNKTFAGISDLLVKHWNDDNSFYWRRQFPIMKALDWYEWHKIQEDSVLFRHPSKKS